MNEHEKINHVELPATDIEATNAFFKAAFTGFGCSRHADSVDRIFR